MGAYLIATTPRTGSFLLCDLLAQTSVAGYPSEYGCPEDTSVWRDHYGFRLHVEYFFGLPGKLASPNGVFGLKVMRQQFVALVADIERYLGVRCGSAADKLRAYLGRDIRILWLRRRDKCSQAVSLARALQTGQWSSEVPGAGGPPRYDADAIRQALRSILEHEDAWSGELSEMHLPVLEIWYEDLAERPAATARRALRWLGGSLPPGVDPVPRLERQADELSREWSRRFRSERG